MDKFDVVIIGAGPAGLKAAEILAKAKKKVIVLEKNKIIGKKVCAAGITNKDLEYIPKNLIEKSFPNFSMISGKKSYNLPYPIHIIERESLGNYMEKKAEKAGAVIIKNNRVKKITKTYVLADKKYYFNHLIGADGSNSLVRKSLKLSTSLAAIAMHFKTKTISEKVEIIYNSKEYGIGYIWIFPHKNYTSLGVGTALKLKNKKNLKKKLENFAKARNFNIDNAEFEAEIINSDYKGYKFGNIFLVGDAAGLANPFTGEGIYEAIVSGEEVANKIIGPNYPAIKLKRTISKHLKLSKVSNVLTRLPFLISPIYRLGFMLLRFKSFKRKLVRLFIQY